MTQIILTNKAMLISLNIGRWNANAKDEQTSNEVATSKRLANAKMARVWKSLMEKNPHYDAVVSAEKKARRFHDKNTFAYVQNGYRILTTANYDHYMSTIRAIRAEWEPAVKTFIAKMPEIQQAATLALNSLYREQDYPSDKALKLKFHFSTTVLPLPSGAVFEADLPEEEKALIRANIEEELQQVFRNANRELWDRLYAQIHRMKEQLASPKGLQGATLKSLREMLAMLDRLNFTGDEQLEKLRAEAEAQLAGLSAKAINNNRDTHAVVVARAAQMESAMSAFMGGSAHAA